MTQSLTQGVSINVRGLPRPQGSMRAHPTPNGKIAMRYPPAVYEWRARVQQACADEMALNGTQSFLGAVELHLGFELPRPANHFGTGRNAGTIKGSAPDWPTTMPDLDKLTRCVCDAVTDSGLWADDSQVCVIVTAKRYSDSAGVHIQIIDLDRQIESEDDADTD
jgi:Holliday junction resolvase RusA-like endonuclease